MGRYIVTWENHNRSEPYNHMARIFVAFEGVLNFARGLREEGHNEVAVLSEMEQAGPGSPVLFGEVVE